MNALFCKTSPQHGEVAIWIILGRLIYFYQFWVSVCILFFVPYSPIKYVLNLWNLFSRYSLLFILLLQSFHVDLFWMLRNEWECCFFLCQYFQKMVILRVYFMWLFLMGELWSFSEWWVGRKDQPLSNLLFSVCAQEGCFYSVSTIFLMCCY